MIQIHCTGRRFPKNGNKKFINQLKNLPAIMTIKRRMRTKATITVHVLSESIFNALSVPYTLIVDSVTSKWERYV